MRISVRSRPGGRRHTAFRRVRDGGATASTQPRSRDALTDAVADYASATSCRDATKIEKRTPNCLLASLATVTKEEFRIEGLWPGPAWGTAPTRSGCNVFVVTRPDV